MKGHHVIFFIGIALLTSCHRKSLEFDLYSNGERAYIISPEDIEFYDTSENRGRIEFQELRLKKNFFKSDSIVLVFPIVFSCSIGGKQHYKASFFHKTQSYPHLNINFHFRSSCENLWNFPEVGDIRLTKGDTLVLHAAKCNSIELFHSRNEIEESREIYYKKIPSFRDYVDTARLAHEILFDPYYLNAIKESGIPIR